MPQNFLHVGDVSAAEEIRTAADAAQATMRIIDPEHAARHAQNFAEAPAAAAVVSAHLDEIARTPAERAYVLDMCADTDENALELVDWAYRLELPYEWCGIQASPGATRGRASADELAHVPTLTTNDAGALFLRLGGEREPSDDGPIVGAIEARIYNAPERIFEVVRLLHHGLVALSTRDEVFILTEEEYSSQV